MKKLFLVVSLVLLCAMISFGQSDTNGLPDIYLPGPGGSWCAYYFDEGVKVDVVLGYDPASQGAPPEWVFLVDPASQGPPGWTNGSTKKTVGFKFNTDDPTKGGTEYVKVSGSFGDMTAQVYIPKGMNKGEKAEEIANEFNRLSDLRADDPIIASAAKGSVVVQPAAGEEMKSSEWDNGSGEENNSTDTLTGSEDTGQGSQPASTEIFLYASTLSGIPAGYNHNNEIGNVSVGCGGFRVSTFVSVEDTHYTILKRLEFGLNQCGIKCLIGYDEQANPWLVWESTSNHAKFGNTDDGLSNKLITDHGSPSLGFGDFINIGDYVIFVGYVDPDEAMPFYRKPYLK